MRKIVLYLILILFIFSIIFPLFQLKVEGSTTEIVTHTYICDDIDAQAYKGGTIDIGLFNNDDSEFTQYNYTSIKTDDKRYVSDFQQPTFENPEDLYQYHRFDFPIIEELSSIIKIEINWKGDGGGKSLYRDPEVNYLGCSFWVKENHFYEKKINNTKSQKTEESTFETFTIEYKSDFEKILKKGHIYCAAQSDIKPDVIHTLYSYLNSQYVEIVVTYETTFYPQLIITAPSTVEEGELFNLEIKSDGNPIENVTIIFNEISYLTNIDSVSLEAPYVEYDTSFSIIASKEGYLSDEKTILVTNSEQFALPKLIITAPSEAEEGSIFNLFVNAEGSPIRDVNVMFNGNSYLTGINGNVSLQAPLVDDNSLYTINASKSNYLSDEVSILITDSTPSVMPNLIINSQSTVIEENSFQVMVTSNDLPIKDATITFNKESFLTDEEGIVSLNAPKVDGNTDFQIVASKINYKSLTKWILVTESETTSLPQLLITIPSTVTEGDSFYVKITSNEIAIDDAMISFAEGTYFSDQDGIKIITAPSVEKDKIYYIKACKEGFQPYSIDINIKNDENRIFYGYIEGDIIDKINNPIKDVFLCCLISQENNIFTSKCTYTDENGEFIMLLPVGSYNIKAVKTGYNDNSKNKIIVNSNTKTQVDLTLEEIAEQDAKSFIEYTIEEEIKKDQIVGTVDITKDYKKISQYSNVDIDLISTDINSDEGVKIVFSGDENPGTKIAIYLGEDYTFDDLYVTYDRVKIQQNKNVELFFNKNNDKTDCIYIDNYLILNIPQYSEHTITIKSIVKSIGGITAFLAYITIAIILLLAITIHMKYIWKK